MAKKDGNKCIVFAVKLGQYREQTQQNLSTDPMQSLGKEEDVFEWEISVLRSAEA